MSQTSRRHFLREKEATRLLLNISQKLKVNPKHLFGTKTPVESTETQDYRIFLINGKPLLASCKDTLLPTLIFAEALNRLPRIVVNMGAVSHICNGADVMAPGVVQIQGVFQTNEFLQIVDERHRKPLAIGTALFDSEHMKTLKQGRIVKNLHFVGDRLWKFLRKF